MNKSFHRWGFLDDEITLWVESQFILHLDYQHCVYFQAFVRHWRKDIFLNLQEKWTIVSRGIWKWIYTEKYWRTPLTIIFNVRPLVIWFSSRYWILGQCSWWVQGHGDTKTLHFVSKRKQWMRIYCKLTSAGIVVHDIWSRVKNKLVVTKKYKESRLFNS